MPPSKNYLLIMAIAAMQLSRNVDCMSLRARDDSDDSITGSIMDITNNFK